jgi:hypothetical protein
LPIGIQKNDIDPLKSGDCGDVRGKPRLGDSTILSPYSYDLIFLLVCL